MASRRRANNRGSRGRTNLDDLDGALTSMIVPQKEVKIVVDPAEERRFTMHAQNELNDASRGIFAASCQREEIDLSGFNATHTADFAKHQKDYSETKRIKPWRTGTKSQILPPQATFKKNSGKGGKNTIYTTK